MTDDNEEVLDLTSDDLSKEDKIEKLEQLCNEVGLDIEELAGGPIEDVPLEGVLTLTVTDDDENVKASKKVEF